MAKITPITEHFQHFLADLKESFWGDVYGATKVAWKNFLEQESLRQRDRWTHAAAYERKPAARRDYRNGYYERDFVTRFGTIRLRIARTRGKNFLPKGIERFQRRADELALLPMECAAMAAASCWPFCVPRERVRESGRGYCRICTAADSKASICRWLSPTDVPVWRPLCRWSIRGPFTSAAGVHKMRNILQNVRQCDYADVKAGAQAIYLAESRARAQAAFRRFQARWRSTYGPMVRRLDRDLPQLLSFFSFPQHLWRKLRTTNIIERCFVEVRRRTRPMVCFVNVQSVDRIIYSIFHRFNLEWKTRTLRVFTQAA